MKQINFSTRIMSAFSRLLRRLAMTSFATHWYSVFSGLLRRLAMTIRATVIALPSPVIARNEAIHRTSFLYKSFCWLIVLLVGFHVHINGQNTSELEAQRKAVLEEIEVTIAGIVSAFSN